MILRLLDHDVYPMAPVQLGRKLTNKDFYGYAKERTDSWYLWVGFCFFDFNRAKHLPLNFLPYTINGTYLDTGGANSPELYKNYNIETLNLPDRQTVQISNGNDCHLHFVQIIDECWLHTINSSNWTGSPE